MFVDVVDRFLMAERHPHRWRWKLPTDVRLHAQLEEQVRAYAKIFSALPEPKIAIACRWPTPMHYLGEVGSRAAPRR